MDPLRNLGREFALVMDVSKSALDVVVEPRWDRVGNVYPRVYGEAGDALSSSSNHPGLSSRMQGSRGRAVRVAASARSILAYAGEPLCLGVVE